MFGYNCFEANPIQRIKLLHLYFPASLPVTVISHSDFLIILMRFPHIRFKSEILASINLSINKCKLVL